MDFYYNKALNAKENDLIFWLSPSDGNSPYTEARINVARVRNLYGLKVLECYGIPSKLSPEEVLKIANYFLQMSEEKTVLKPDDLRKISILWPGLKDEDVWKMFQNTAPLDSNAWELIAKGIPRKIKREVYKIALPVAEEMSNALENAKKERDFVVIGAKGEKYMAKRGWKIDKYQCEGLLNSDLLNNTIKIDAFGNFRKVNSLGEKKAQYVKKCPFCDKKYEKVLEPGHVCDGKNEDGSTCGKIFEGIC